MSLEESTFTHNRPLEIQEETETETPSDAYAVITETTSATTFKSISNAFTIQQPPESTRSAVTISPTLKPNITSEIPSPLVLPVTNSRDASSASSSSSIRIFKIIAQLRVSSFIQNALWKTSRLIARSLKNCIAICKWNNIKLAFPSFNDECTTSCSSTYFEPIGYAFPFFPASNSAAAADLTLSLGPSPTDSLNSTERKVLTIRPQLKAYLSKHDLRELEAAQLYAALLLQAVHFTELSNKSYVELGCKNGIGAKILYALSSPKYYLGIGDSITTIESARTFLKTHETLSATPSEINFDIGTPKKPNVNVMTDSIDIVFCVNVSDVNWIDKRVFQTIAATLKPGGLFVFFDITTEAERKKLTKQLRYYKVPIQRIEDVTSNVILSMGRYFDNRSQKFMSTLIQRKGLLQRCRGWIQSSSNALDMSSRLADKEYQCNYIVCQKLDNEETDI